MPRGRHRHSPPLHRLLPPSAIAGVAVVCALTPWVFTSLGVVRALAGVAALTAVGGAVVMRQWDAQAGKQVAELTRARVSDEWRYDERVAELETDLEESRELRAKLERRLRAKRAELAGLRNEHASLLRRYATAETERASALEGRRLLEIEAVPESGALALTAGPSAEAGVDTTEAPRAAEPVPAKELYLKAATALARLERSAEEPEAEAEDKPEPEAEAGAEVEAVAKGDPDSAGTGAGDTGDHTAAEGLGPVDAEGEVTEAHTTAEETPEEAQAHTPGTAVVPARSTGQRPAGHFTVPTAVAVVPAAPSRRPLVEGGFDFFGTQKDTSAALDVRNEDLADVVGQEALALHKADAGTAYKPAGTYDVGQVIDLTAHDETEHIDVEGLRSAAS
ncbi:hypothetical protein EV284_5272 [Streptomyces sp. BK022]|uniref:hypothetical protein n=1 Tax=Streptomyces sp. BK022 TaxID=2512123 RepID=UPI001028C5D4|nr:hypothetical protein [Streptomyces sp. BK022]RZU30313.1 hypothetical protein EV284_5272 [Streptomyces sp. BK022]